MSQCLSQLDKVLSIAKTEYSALLDGDITEAENLCEQRDSLMRNALAVADTIPQRMLCERLLTLQGIQQKLCDEARRQREELREQLLQTKKETRRMNAYHQSMLITSN